jgi:predicted acyltransferase
MAHPQLSYLPSQTAIVLNQRFYSLDVFRGATVCLMILVNNPGSWSHIYAPLEHAPWHGLTPTDLVFPFFLFAVGNALAMVMPRFEQGTPAQFWKKLLKRTALIFLIGLFLNWWPFVVQAGQWVADASLPGGGEIKKGLIFKGFTWTDWVKNDNGTVDGIERGVRIMGVLQRIALAYFFAAVIAFYVKGARAFYAAMLLLLGYWALCLLGSPVDPYSLNGWFGTGIDKAVLGSVHMYKGEGIAFDPEGLISTIPAISQVLFGFLVGDYIRQKANEKASLLNGLFVAGVALLLTGFCWDMVMPINKKIWTSSYVVYTTGLAITTIATMMYLIEIKGIKSGLARFFDVFGKNALFVFALSAFLPKGLALIKLEQGVNPWNWLYKKVLVHVPGAPENGSLLYALAVITFMWFICYWMDKKKIYIKV